MNTFVNAGSSPLVLTLPGLGNSGPAHWQSLWEQGRDDIHRVELGMWDQPHRNSWVNQISLAIRHADRPVVLVAHSLGCIAAAWWAAMEDQVWTDKVVGALLVAPPEVDVASSDARLHAFGPVPKGMLPFPSILVASRNDSYIRFDRARRLADFWGSTFVDAGDVGHINADSGLANWEFGLEMLDLLVFGRTERQNVGSVSHRPDAGLSALPDLTL